MFYANLAKDSYENIGARKGFLNYKYLQDESSENLATYVNDKKRELAFAIPGTSKAGDIMMDAGIAIASAPLLGFDGRYEKISNKIKEVKNKYDDYNVSVTGHSAGGSLANYLGVDNPDYAINTFNMAQGLPFLTNSIKCKLGNCENINNFRIVGDWASSMSEAYSPGKVFNMRPKVTTQEMEIDAESKESFFFPSYMNIPHTVNQFIDRDEDNLLSDYGLYGRKLSRTIGGVGAAVGLPYVTKKLNTAINTYANVRPNVRRLRKRDYLSRNPLMGPITNFFGGMANMNVGIGGITGFGLGDITGTALYDNFFKSELTDLKGETIIPKTEKKKKDKQFDPYGQIELDAQWSRSKKLIPETEFTDLNSEKYFSNTLTSIALGGLAAGIVGYMRYQPGWQPRANVVENVIDGRHGVDGINPYARFTEIFDPDASHMYEPFTEIFNPYAPFTEIFDPDATLVLQPLPFDAYQIPDRNIIL
tara:strand:- start:165 stop:1595 length:1431 start_codon:yes stop_codon:yes gene_type:complete